MKSQNRIDEITLSDITPLTKNVKYAQQVHEEYNAIEELSLLDIAPLTKNVKYAQQIPME
ncbi:MULTISPECIES: hypothetical protein [Photorhabdus]|uniref:Uncharacterized protein n=2 Tax=Photorhabdus TaxID=29487 RepID=A0ABX0ASU8_9GAMM|nr:MULTISPECIES: hypothetical protein [Photorhabdus]MCC8376356.1 hypothetical protein [Photorhabdus bodei]MCC8466581.1 hypothetical protein [Photorhabdus bodei]MCT8353170.1 hypothetical protein [Photorhabdus kayaii]MDB6368846.1 hypothetical protein [Photorhabdus bodei]MDB6374012.1 hypothetical protein [Photorhabdus bodei]